MLLEVMLLISNIQSDLCIGLFKEIIITIMMKDHMLKNGLNSGLHTLTYVLATQNIITLKVSGEKAQTE